MEEDTSLKRQRRAFSGRPSRIHEPEAPAKGFSSGMPFAGASGSCPPPSAISHPSSAIGYDGVRPMPQEKREHRELKREIKRAGHKHNRNRVKRALTDTPDEAAALED